MRTASPSVPPPGNPVQSGYMYGATNARMGIPDMSGSYHHHLSKVVYDDTMQPTTNQTRSVGYDPQGSHSFRAQYSSSSGMQPEDDAGDDASRRKKVASGLLLCTLTHPSRRCARRTEQNSTCVLRADGQTRQSGERYVVHSTKSETIRNRFLEQGPQGPKTLCNACGLRWAKEVRNKVDENSSGTGSSFGAP